MKHAKLFAASAVSALLCASAANAADYLIGVHGNHQSDLWEKVAAAGGTLQKTYPFGLAVASSDDPAFADKLYDLATVQFVAEDVGFDVHYSEHKVDADAGFPPNSGDDDFLFDLQWGHNYVGAQQAWDAGYRGQGVTVAILDGGFDIDHPDLAPNIVLTQDFTGQGVQYACADTFSHGSHTAGTVGAADNGIGTIGVAPEASLMLVKVLAETATCSGSGSFADVIDGIIFATENGADVINMSLGATIARQGQGGANADISALQNAVNKAITYAYQNGTTVIVSAGNDAADLDGGDKGAVRFNTGMSHAVGISAHGPYLWAQNPNQGIDLAYYSNYGTSMVDFGAPGGDATNFFEDIGDDGVLNNLCTVIGITRPCYVFDMVMSVGNNGWYWSQGTSMSSPHAAGVAALIISETGDSTPSHVIRELRRRATDEGKPGRDDDYGHGLANSGH